MNDNIKTEAETLTEERKEFAAEFIKQVLVMKQLMTRADELDVNAVFGINADDTRKRSKRWVATAEVLTKPEITSIAAFKE